MSNKDTSELTTKEILLLIIFGICSLPIGYFTLTLFSITPLELIRFFLTTLEWIFDNFAYLVIFWLTGFLLLFGLFLLLAGIYKLIKEGLTFYYTHKTGD